MVEDMPHSGCPATAIIPDIILIVELLVAEDPHVAIEEVAEHSGISAGTAHTILHEHLHMTKICSRWVPHLLTISQQAERVELAQSLLNKMRRWGADGVKNIVTGDEEIV